MGKSSLLAAVTARAKELSFRIGHGTSAPVEGAWPYAPVVEALADLCRRHPTLLDGLPDHHREEIDRALAGAEIPWTGESSHQRLFVAAAELVRLASATNGLLLTIDDVHDADDASLRLLHYIARSTHDQRVCIVLAHRPAPIDRHAGGDAPEPDRPPRRDRARARPARRRRHRGARASPRRRAAAPSWSSRSPRSAGASRSPCNELARRAANEPRWVQALDANMIGGIAPATREVLQRVAVVGSSFDTDEFVALSGLPEDEAFDHLDAALAALDRRADERRLPVPPRPRARRAPRRRAAPPAPAHPSRRRQPPRSSWTRRRRASATTCCRPGATAEAVPYLLRAAETEAAVGAYRDALGARRRGPAARHRRAPGDRAVAAGRPAQRHRRPDGGVGLPGGARRRRRRQPRGACGSGSPAAR